MIYLDVDCSGYQHMPWQFPSDLIHESVDAFESSPKGPVADIISTHYTEDAREEGVLVYSVNPRMHLIFFVLLALTHHLWDV